MSIKRALGFTGPTIDGTMRRTLAPLDTEKFAVQTTQLPAYRFVDLAQAIDAWAGDHGEVKQIDCQNDEDLSALLHGQAPTWSDRSVRRANKVAWVTGPDSEIFLPVDRFWVAGGSAKSSGLVVRLRFRDYSQQAILEVASSDADAGEALLQRIVDDSITKSIYRNKILRLGFEAGTRDEYGDVEKPEQFRVLFVAQESVPADDIVLDPAMLKILERNVIDLQRRRDVLKAHGVPVRRGVLLYGPPGTGKTYTCRYLCGQMPETTRIFVTGTALTQVGAIFAIARLYQPSLLILEDVDLIFASREINLYSTGLGDLLDQMDGVRPYEDIGILLTTNAIDRLEAAIKDRPGRISQCLFFGPPNKRLRERYLKRYLRDYDIEGLKFPDLVERSDGVTQAFLKEWVHRSVQIATERLDGGKDAIALSTADFNEAMDEMTKFSESAVGNIIGFRS